MSYMLNTKAIDARLLVAFGILLVFGLTMLTSASVPVGYSRFGDRAFFIKRQMIFGVIPGAIIFCALALMDYRALKRWSAALYAGTLLLLFAVFIPGIGTRLNTADASWIRLGPFTMQPSEAVKVSMIVFLSAILSARGREILDARRGFLPTVALGMAPVALTLFQPDFGTAIVLFSILFFLLYAARARLAHLLVLAGAGATAFAALIVVAPYRVARVTTFLYPELDPKGVGYQINQAYLAIGSGGLLGLGLGHSRQKFQYLPEVHADSIFAIIAEETGFIFSAVFILLLLYIAYLGLSVARQTSDSFGQLLSAGIVAWFMIQSFVNIGAMLGLLPLTGVPLPFVSHGGTALAAALAGAGLLVSIGRKQSV